MSMVVGRASNADRARYAVRASPSTNEAKDQTVRVSLRKKTRSAKVRVTFHVEDLERATWVELAPERLGNRDSLWRRMERPTLH